MYIQTLKRVESVKGLINEVTSSHFCCRSGFRQPKEALNNGRIKRLIDDQG